MVSRRVSVGAVVVLLLASLMPSVAEAGRRPTAVDWPAACEASAEPLQRAQELMEDRYRFDPHPLVTLPSDPAWSEDPLGDPNWQFQLHSLRFVIDLLRAWWMTGDDAYRDRALFLLRDWWVDDPVAAPPSPYSWDDHATAWRAMTYACAAELVPKSDWLDAALRAHGRMLARPGFYVWHGNHALNQSVGLLEVGRVLGRSGWMLLARDRLRALVVESVDAQGVANEQALGYQAYAHHRWVAARRRLRDAGLGAGAAFDRVALMPGMLVAGSLPAGGLEMIGDTERPRPVDLARVRRARAMGAPLIRAFAAGYLFARSGWGEVRAAADETFLSVRWGVGRRYHGHLDGTSLTLAAWGSPLLLDAGKYTYARGPWRRYFVGRRAHDVVTVDGLRWDVTARTRLLGLSRAPGVVDLRLRTSGYPGVVQTRRITWSRHLDYVLVEDRVASTRARRYHQLWHLVEDSAPVMTPRGVRTTRVRGNILIRQLAGQPVTSIVQGSADPIQGWVSYRYGRKAEAAVVDASLSGRSARFLTLLVPSETRRRVGTSGLALTPDGYRLTVTIDGRSERIVADGAAISVASVDG